MKKNIYAAIDDEAGEVLLIERTTDGSYNATVYKFFGARDEWCVRYSVMGVYDSFLAKLHAPTTARELAITARAVDKLKEIRLEYREYSVFPIVVGEYVKAKLVEADKQQGLSKEAKARLFRAL